MAYSNSDEIFITMHADDKEAFYAKIPYDKLPSIHRIGGKWMQSGKEWRFPLDDQIWENFQKEFASEFAAGKVHKDAAFLLAFDKRHKDLDKFLKFKEVAMRDEPTEFGVEGLSYEGKNPLFNYQKWGIKCGLYVGDGFLIGDQPGLGKCQGADNMCNFSTGIDKVSSIVDRLSDEGWYPSVDGIGEWHDIENLSILGNNNGKDVYFPVKRAYREKVVATGTLKLQNGLLNTFGLNHKFYTNNGWKRFDELTVNDWILVNDRICPPVQNHYDLDDVYWLAWQIGEGCDCGSHLHSITNTDLNVLRRLKQCIEKHRANIVAQANNQFDYPVVIHKDNRIIENHLDRYWLNFNHRYTEYLRNAFGYKMFTKSGDKEIPMSILNSDDECARVFTRALWDAEGCCNKDNLEFSSKSYDVVEKMWYLLKRFGIFGIVSSKTAKVKNGRNTYWKLLVDGRYARMFKEKIGFETDYKQQALESLCTRRENTNIGYSSPCRHILKHLVEDVLQTSYNLVGLENEKVYRNQEYSIAKMAEFVGNLEKSLKEGVHHKKSKWSHFEDNFNRNRIEKKDEVMQIVDELKTYYIGSVQWLKVSSVDINKKIDYVYDFEVDDDNHNYYASGMLTHNTIQALGIAKDRMNKGEIRNCLIVCPASLKYNWRDEVTKFLGMEALVIGHKCKNASDREKHWIAEGYPFKIVNYELVARDLYCEPKRKDNRISCAKAVLSSFDLVIFDEIQYLKHHSSARTLACRTLQAKYRIGLSGTPIDGRLEEIHSIFQILKPGLFVSKQKFMERYAEYDYFGAVKGYHHIKEVSDKIAPYYLRRLKEEVLKDLPPKLHQDLHVELSAQNMKAYKDLVKKKNEITEEASAAELLIRARQFLDFPEILGMHNSSDKYAVFKELLDELVKENHQKVIVFSQYTNTIYWIVKNLESEYKGIQVIDGSVGSEERQEICKRFNTDDKYNILVMSDAGCTGLNLPAAHACIMYTDAFSPAVMLQREDRCHRATTKHSVMIYRFITDGTIEEHVRDILAKKQSVNNALLGEKIDSFKTGELSAMELLSCL